MADDGAPRQIVIQLDRWVEAQKAVVKNVGDFVVEATDMTLQGEWSPTNWMERYGKMWINLANDIRALGKR